MVNRAGQCAGLGVEHQEVPHASLCVEVRYRRAGLVGEFPGSGFHRQIWMIGEVEQQEALYCR